jgi:hypothetical protein
MNYKFENVKRCHHESVGMGALCSWKVDTDVMKRACDCEPMSMSLCARMDIFGIF